MVVCSRQDISGKGSGRGYSVIPGRLYCVRWLWNTLKFMIRLGGIAGLNRVAFLYQEENGERASVKCATPRLMEVWNVCVECIYRHFRHNVWFRCL